MTSLILPFADRLQPGPQPGVGKPENFKNILKAPVTFSVTSTGYNNHFAPENFGWFRS